MEVVSKQQTVEVEAASSLDTSAEMIAAGGAGLYVLLNEIYYNGGSNPDFMS